jgi:hypothetical protein
MSTETEFEQRFKNLDNKIDLLYQSVQGKGVFAQPSPQVQTSSLDKVDETLEKFEAPRLSIQSLIPDRSDIPMLVAGVGAASAAGVASYVQQYIPNINLGQIGLNPTNAAKLISGWVIYKIGGDYHPLAGAFGGGVLINAISDMARGAGLYVKPKSNGGNGNGGGVV